MNNIESSKPVGRRDAIARLVGAAISVFGLTAFKRSAPSISAAGAARWDDRFELAVDIEIAQQQGFRTHRPYVAVWIEDPAGRRIRTVGLSVNTSGRGPRYIRELRRWFDGERAEEEAGGPDVIATMSSATRLPGQYLVTWNGRDDRGNVVEQGTYRVIVEAAREHGSYQLMQQELKLGTTRVAADLGSNEEIASARVEYRRRK